MKTLPTLFSRTSTGAIQTWQMIVDGNKYYSITGQQDGKKIENEPTVCEGKNIGKKNETSPSEQAYSEAEAKWDKKSKTGYTTDVKKIDECTSYVEPMLAKKYEDVDFSFPVYTQPKLDGMRCIVRKDGMWSRTGKKIASAPHIYNALKHLFEEDPSLIFDGEIFCDKFKNDFNSIISLAKQTKPTKEDLNNSEVSLQYWVYDLPSSELIFSERNAELKRLLPKHNSIVMVDLSLIHI